MSWRPLRWRGTRQPAPALPRPDQPTYVIGDIHGCRDAFHRLQQMIDQDMADHGIPDAECVLVGDYIDRGPNSAEVLAEIMALSALPDTRFTCLRGNHEAMFLQFLTGGATEARHWLQHGGVDTLHSYGIATPGRLSKDETVLEIQAKATQTLPIDTLIPWIEARPLCWRSGNLAVVHAAMDPALSPEDQTEATLLWGHAGFLRRRRKDGLWVVHGHTITKTPTAQDGRIAIDTGAYRSGILTATALIPDAQPRFLSTPPVF